MIERKSSLLLQLRRATRHVRRANTARRELESIPPTPRAATEKTNPTRDKQSLVPFRDHALSKS